MPKAIRIHETGGPDVLTWEDIRVDEPGDGQIRIKQVASGLNFIDCYQRSGLYPMDLPTTLGSEGVGVVEAVGPGVDKFTVGQRVAYAGGERGSYAEARIMPATAVVALPDNVDDFAAAAMMLKGMTVHMLMFKCHTIQAGETILVHAAAGGVGTIMCQWANYLGATVIGTVGSDEKAQKARNNGCQYTINYTTENFTEKVLDITNGKGVPVVYDSIGKNTFQGSLDCLHNFGDMVTFGNASGPVPPVEPLLLMQKGSVTLSRPTLMSYTTDLSQRDAAADALFHVVGNGHVKIEIGQTFPLSETADAHRDLESRQTTGSTVLTI